MIVESWTDDDGVTHNMSGIMASCFVNVTSKRGPCVSDTPPRPVTCIACVSGDSWMKLIADMQRRGIVLGDDVLERARELCGLEKIPMKI